MGSRKGKSNESAVGTELRIVGGRYRGSKLRYHGDPVTRPMKDCVREAIFNLIGMEVEGKHAIDLFAGTGALGLESLSRGASGATFIEKHVPTARVVKENIAALGVQQQANLLTTSAFLWAKRDMPNLELSEPMNFPSSFAKAMEDKSRQPPSAIPLLVFCSPPYAFFVDRQEDMLDLIQRVLGSAPAGSILVIEADCRFDFELLPGGVAQHKREKGWDVRTYPPAVVGVWRV